MFPTSFIQSLRTLKSALFRGLCLILCLSFLCLPAFAQEQPESSSLSVPLYYQTDYPDQRYGTGTIATNGSSITCLAMVATALTGYEYLPDELAKYFGGDAQNSIERLEIASTALELPWRKAENVHDTFAALKEGCIAIVLMGSKSIFTSSQHYLVLTGLTSEGKILVNDPYQPHYDQWLLRSGLADGFKEGDLIAGYSGGWIYDVSAMPEDPVRYSESEPTTPSRYTGITLTEEEETLLANVLYLEAAGEPEEGQQAIAEVILNRIADDSFRDNLNGVLFADGQFPSTDHLYLAKPSQTQYDAIETPNPETVYFLTDANAICLGSRTYVSREKADRFLVKRVFAHDTYGVVAYLDTNNTMELSGYFAEEISRIELWLVSANPDITASPIR